MPKVTVCGIRGVLVRNERTYGGGNIFPGARDIGRYAKISKAQAKRLMLAIHATERLPRPGYQSTLCSNTYLSNKSGTYEIERRASGEFAGTKRRRRRRRRR